MFNYIIVGAGFAGSVIAERLASQKKEKVLIIEKHNHIGGHCFDYKDENNIIVHKYGPHLFHTNNKKVFEYLSQFTEWDIYNHEVLAYIDGKKVPLPFNLNTLYELFPVSLANKYEQKLLEKYKLNTKVPILELKQSEDKDLKYLADYIYEKVFLNYTAKQWDKTPEEIDSFVTARVPLFIGKDNRYFNDIYQVVPRHGYTRLFENMLNNPNIKLMLNTNFKEVATIKNDQIYVLGHKFNGIIIYTGCVDELFDYQFGELRYRSVHMKFETIQKEWYQEKATVNYPNSYNFTRITEFKHIHFCESKNTTILKEYPMDYIRGKNDPYYPVFTEENQKKYQKYVDYAKRFPNIKLVGRLAEYKYYDMDDIVERALEVAEKEL
ncbi:UDP-galactopyranose mutase [Treponema sp. J25]|uniref:UDP-galactopyranose mutase n=1 Tax=Treponema sp. J25 TaxID=2094121 RepID=UPI00105304F6|nr:UDP-galactopyranose mutase [Treponema sp. J25]TCW60159.1 UDP-galactopyranose mutase [Treponema sp. J25]